MNTPSAPPSLALLSRSPDLRLQAIARAARPDYEAWVSHVKAASGCTRPIRLAGDMYTLRSTGPDSAEIIGHRSTDSMPDGVIYKPCGNRRASVCPSCSDRYKRDAYQIINTLLVGGKGVPDTVSKHPAVFVTFTAPSFGPVHTRVVRRHTCSNRQRCDCRPDPCHARRDADVCPHGHRLVCFARHEPTDAILGTPICLDCYDHDAQVVWNLAAPELWRRTSESIRKYLRRAARPLGIPGNRVRLQFGKAAEYQARGVVHFHIIARLDGADPDDPDAILPPPAGLTAATLVDAFEHAAGVSFVTDPHAARPDGWPIAWGDPDKGIDIRVVSVNATGEVNNGMVAAYLAKYATKSTEVTGHLSGRLNGTTVDLYADPDGDHTARLIDACWRLGDSTPPRSPREPWPCPTCRRETRLAVCPSCRADNPPEVDPEPADDATPDDSTDDPYAGLRRSAHMLGFAGHFLTKSRRHPVTFRLLRNNRVVFRRTETTGPDTNGQTPEAPTVLVVNFLAFVGAGWQTPADAMLANTSAAMAREHHEAAVQDLATLAA